MHLYPTTDYAFCAALEPTLVSAIPGTLLTRTRSTTVSRLNPCIWCRTVAVHRDGPNNPRHSYHEQLY